MTDVFLITTDGGSRGNPGAAATGFTLRGPGISPVARGRYIGTATNNVDCPVTAMAPGLLSPMVLEQGGTRKRMTRRSLHPRVRNGDGARRNHQTPGDAGARSGRASRAASHISCHGKPETPV